MTKSYITLLAISTALLVSACDYHDRATDLPPGKYERTTSSTDANGTTTKQKNVTDVTVDEYGNKRAVVETKTSKDPRGLFNKSTTSSKKVIQENY